MAGDEQFPNIVVDAHEDIAVNTILFGRDFAESAYAKRKREATKEGTKAWGVATTGLPESLLGRVGLIFGTLFVEPKWSSLTGASYETPVEAYKQALKQIDVYHRLAETNSRIGLVRNQRELSAVLATWAEGKDFEQHKVGILISMEGADPVLEPKQFEEWYERGVRAIGLAWSETRYSGGTHRPGPLTNLGRELLEALEPLHVILDLSHMAEEAYLEAIDRYSGPIIASHSNPRSFRNTDRHLSDDMILRLAERDGVMGVVPYNAFLRDDFSANDKKSKTPLLVVINAIDHICQVTGSARHAGIGSDFDGGFGAGQIPAEMDTVADLRLIGPGLAERGYSAEDVAAILGGNFLRVLRASLPT